MSVSRDTMCHMANSEIVDAKEIGQRIYAARVAARQNQQAFAERTGLSRAYISRLERGLVPNPTITDLGKIAQALGLSVADLTLQQPELIETRYSTDWH